MEKFLSLFGTAGKAKNEIPRRAQNEAIIFPVHVSGVLSPYPTVDKVIWKKYRPYKFRNNRLDRIEQSRNLGG